MNTCKGLIFRASTNNYFAKGRIVNSKELRLLKRKSCPGCEHCLFIYDYLQNLQSEGLIPEDLKDGKLYVLKIKSHKYWTDCGYEYDCDMYFELLKEPGQ